MRHYYLHFRWLLVFLPVLMSAGVLWAVDTPGPVQNTAGTSMQESVITANAELVPKTLAMENLLHSDQGSWSLMNDD